MTVLCDRSAGAALSRHIAETLSSTIVSAVESISHTHSWIAVSVWSSIGAATIPTSSTIHVPAVSASVYGVEVRTSEEIVVSARVSCIDAEVPITSIPVEWAVEVCSVQIGSVLPVEKYVA